MKKILSIVLIILIITGCGNNTARSAVESYMKKYKTLDSEVLVDLENMIKEENLSNADKDKYRDILKKQYKDLSYDILEEEYDDEVSYVTVKIEVYNLYKAESDALIYLENNMNEFYDENNNYDVDKYINFKLDRMKNTNERVNYMITFTVTKENNKYVLSDLTSDDLKKIHGIYNYEIN